MNKLVWISSFMLILLLACGDKQEEKNVLTIEKQKIVDSIDVIDSAELKKREQEMMIQDSILKEEEEKRTKAKQECATKVKFLEQFYDNYFKNPESTVAKYCSSKLYGELCDQASQYEGNAIPVWIFASGSGANVSYRVNLPDDEFSNTFVVDISEKSKRYKVYITVVGSNGYYSIDKVKNSLGY